MPAPVKLLLASLNAGKLREYRALAEGHAIALNPLSGLAQLPAFEESAPTFAENAAGKAIHFSRFVAGTVIADDSGLVVPALGGAPGVRSARYTGPGAGDADRVQKLLEEMRGKTGGERRARFVCVLAAAQRGRALAVFSDFADGTLASAPRGTDGFGYDPVFLYPPLNRTFAEMSGEEKNQVSHRGKAFRKLLELFESAGDPNLP